MSIILERVSRLGPTQSNGLGITHRKAGETRLGTKDGPPIAPAALAQTCIL